MTCSGRFAEAWQFASFYCLSSVLAGKDDSGAPPAHATLSCSYINFENLGVEAGVGMVAYNVTKSTSGVITLVSGITLQATGVTWDNGDEFRVVLIDAVNIATMELYLDISAADIHAALAASGQCDCTLASWAATFLTKLNVIDASLYYMCECSKPNLTDEQRSSWLTWMSTQLDNIRQGKLELCSGETGSEFPAVGWAEQSVNEFNSARIIDNDSMRNG